VVTALRLRPIFLAITLSSSVPRTASCAGVYSFPAQRPTGLCPDRFAAADFAASSAAVHTFTFAAAPPFFAAAQIARLLPFVVACPPTPNACRHFHATTALTPNQCLRAAALSVRIAFLSSSLTHRGRNRS
jgi:hypothetical protein